MPLKGIKDIFVRLLATQRYSLFFWKTPMQPITERQPRHGRTRSGARLAIGEELRRQMNELDQMTEELFALQERDFRFVSACLHQQAKKLGAMPARLIRATDPERKVA